MDDKHKNDENLQDENIDEQDEQQENITEKEGSKRKRKKRGEWKLTPEAVSSSSDERKTFSDKLMDSFKNNKGMVNIGLIGIGVIGIVIVIIIALSKESATETQIEFAQAYFGHVPKVMELENEFLTPKDEDSENIIDDANMDKYKEQLQVAIQSLDSHFSDDVKTPEGIVAHIEMGNLAFKSEKYDMAVKYFQKVSELNDRNNPYVAYSYIKEGLCYIDKADHIKDEKLNNIVELYQKGISKFQEGHKLAGKSPLSILAKYYEAFANQLIGKLYFENKNDNAKNYLKQAYAIFTNILKDETLASANRDMGAIYLTEKINTYLKDIEITEVKLGVRPIFKEPEKPKPVTKKQTLSPTSVQPKTIKPEQIPAGTESTETEKMSDTNTKDQTTEEQPTDEENETEIPVDNANTGLTQD